MRKIGVGALMCATGLLAGCGSSGTKTVTHTTPGTTTTTTVSGTGTTQASGPGSTTSSGGPVIGSTGTMGPPAAGQYVLTNQTVLQHLTNKLGSNLASHGYTHLQGSCRAFSQNQAQCEFTGVNPQGQQFDDTFTLTVNLSSGAFTVSNVHAGRSMVGSSGTMGPPPGGGRFDLTNHTVLQHLTNKLGSNLASHGYSNLRGACKAFSHTQAECAFKGTDPRGQHFADLFTLTVNLSTGAFRISNVRPVH
jgi:hypothetical protein